MLLTVPHLCFCQRLKFSSSCIVALIRQHTIHSSNVQYPARSKTAKKYAYIGPSVIAKCWLICSTGSTDLFHIVPYWRDQKC